MEKEDKVKVKKIPTEHEEKLELPTGEVVSLSGFLVWMGNKLLTIEKAVE